MNKLINERMNQSIAIRPFGYFWITLYNYFPPEDDQSILIETSSCNLQFFSELIITQLRILHGVTVNSLILFTMQSFQV